MEPQHIELQLEMGDGAFVSFIVDGEDWGKKVQASLGKGGWDDCLPWPTHKHEARDCVLGARTRREGCERALLLYCGCGESGCSSVWARVVVEGELLIIRDVETWYAGKQYVSSLPPLVVRRAQFDAEVGRIAAEIERVNGVAPARGE